ncbi:DUF5979 domain-containing protein [Leifsonia sp. NPDC058194]|uniref:DUF5979 domain-containing protein n=1 Tax=Leifsonia sp. NPDC058194 TaxID=3346374 RepID=UPI0036D9090B
MLALVLLGTSAIGVQAANADDLGSGVLNLSKTTTVTDVEPGQQFVYTLNFGCSSTTTGCVDATITDPIPAPLTVVGTPTVVGGSGTVTVDGGTLKVVFGDAVPNTTPASTGLAAGATGTVQFIVKVPDDIAKSYDAKALTNTATFTAANAATVQASVPVTVHVPDVLSATASKTWTPAATQYTAGEQSTATLKAASASNIDASTLTISEPADPSAAGGVFDFYDFAGFGDVTFPDGADQVQIVAVTAGGEVAGPVGASPALPATVAAGDVIGLKIVFSSSQGGPTITPGAHGSAGIVFAQRATDRHTGAALVAGGTRVNTITSTIATPKGDATSSPASASQEIAPLTVSVSADKSFSVQQLPAGQSTTATLTATNTSTGALTSLSVREPGTGTFFSDKISFGGFASGSAWPEGATGATVSWSVNTGAAPADSSFTSSSGVPSTPTLAPGQYITAFTVTYTGTIATGATATLPFRVGTTTDAGPAGSGFVTYPNAATVTGTNAAGTAEDAATANLEVYFPEVMLTLDKTITPQTVIPGGASLVQLSAQTPSGTSSVRPDTIVVTEPQDTAAAPYWNAFDATAIAPTSVPAGSKLTIEYTTDGTTWKTLTTVDATSGAKSYSAVLDDVLPSGTSHSDVRGLRFTFTDPAGFGQATNVKPGIVFVARGTLRDGTGPTNPGTYPALTAYENCSVSSASGNVNGGATITSKPAVDCASANVQATDGGPGPLIASKSWDGTKVLQAQSGTTTGVTLGWGTQTTGIRSMAVQDPATPSPVSSSVFSAFDLVRIDAITPTSTGGATYDPLIRWDKVSKVELFDGTAWNDITAKACTSANACDGTFPGYTLSTAERSTTQGVRLTFVESPNRAAAIAATADPTAPTVGSGVASASAGAFPGADANARTIHLDLKLRNTVRGSTATDWVTGTREYNIAGSPGAVDNTVLVQGVPVTGDPFERTASDHVTIIDPTFTTKVTKTANPTTLVIPQPDVPAASYPSTVYTTTIANTSTSSTWQLRLSDPADCTNAATTAPCVFGAYDPAANPLDKLNLTKLAIDLGSAAGVQTSLSVVSLQHRAADGTLSTTTHTIAQAVAMTAAQLSDVVGVSVLLRGTNAQGADGTGATIAPGQKATITLTTQLRPTSRAAGAAPTAGAFVNTVYGALHDDVYPTVQAADTQSATVTLANGNLQVATAKTFTPTSTLQANPTNPIQVNLRARATGTIAPKTLVIEDSAPTFWNAFTLTGFAIPNVPTGADRVTIDAQTGQGAAANWHLGTATTIATASLPAGTAAADVTGLRFTFTKADGSSFAASNNADNVRLSVSLRSLLRDGSGPVASTAVSTPMPGETATGTITDTVLADAAYNEVHATQAKATATFTVNPGTAAIAVEKTSPGQAASGREVNWTLRFKNTGTGYLPNPVVTDTLPADGSLLYVPTNVPIFSTSTGGTLPTDATKVTRTYDQAAGTIRFTWPAGSQLAPGETYSITIALQIKPGLAPGSVATNRFGVSTDRTLTSGVCTALNPGNGRPVTFAANTCSTSNVVTTLSQGSFTASKGVRSDSGAAQNINNPALPCTSDADGYYRYPCAAVSAIGDTDHWKLEMVNGGNVAAKNLTAIDVFPYPGDVGVVDPSLRGSVYTPRFNGDLAFQSSGGEDGTRMDWYVTTSKTPCTQEITPGAAACPAGSWLPSSAVGTTVDAAAVTAVKLVFDFSGAPGAVLPAGGSLKVTYSTTNVPTTVAGDNGAPVTAPVTGVRAWNSFGFYPTYVSGSQPAGPQEPIKSGVILTGGPLQISKTITGAAAEYAPTSFVADIACTIDGVKVALGSASSVTLSKAGGYTARVDGIPVGASCAVTEHGAAGSYGESSRTVSPESVVIATAADASAAVPAGQSVTIANDYATTQLTVTKHVETAATAGSFGPFGMTLVCTSALGTPIPLAAGDAAFTLADGASRTVTGLPVGASCVISETDADGAATTPNHVGITFDGAAETTGDSTTVILTGADGGDTAVVNNHYAAGTLTIAKTVDGDAAGDYGTGPFTVHATCVYDGDQTLFDGDVTIRGGETVTIPGVYPAGTVCDVQETATGGATGSTVDQPSVTIPGDLDGSVQNVTVDVTNTFSAGSVTIEKVRTGDGAATYGAGPFTAQLTCTWVKDGVTLTIPLPDAGRVVLDEANGYTATVTGLIQGAHCYTTETASGGATSVAIAPAAGVTVPAGDPATVTITNTFDTGSLTIDKKRVGSGVALFGAGPFTVQVTCTYPVDGVTTPVDLGTDGTLTLSKANGYTATIDGLIAGASCSVDETDAGLATKTTLDPADGTVTIPSGSAATVTVTNRFDVGHLSIMKSADRPSVSVGDTIVYTIVVTNDGEIDAVNATVTDLLPKGLRVISTSPSSTASAGRLTWTIPALAVGASTTFTVTTVLDQPLDTTNRATVTTPPGPWTPSTGEGGCGDPGVACAVVIDPPRAAGLASTGSDQRTGMLWALGLLVAGAAGLAATRLRRRTPRHG